MTVLVTMMKKSMVGKPGYISEFAENVYVFDKCLKVRASEEDIKGVNKWVCFIEGSPIALVFDVLLTRLSTGYLQAFIYNSKCDVKTVQELGEYNSKNGSWYTSEMYESKLVSTKELLSICKQKYLNNSTEAQVSPVQKSTSAPKNKKYKENLNTMTPERLAELKKKIFG